MNDSLFRHEVAKAQQINRQTGDILLTQSLPMWGITLMIVVMTLSILLFLSFGEFTRKERVFGLTVPGHGAIRMNAVQTGTISACHVQEGAQVAAGDLLFEIRQETFSDLGETQKLIEDNLSHQSEKLADEISNRLKQAQQQESGLKDKARILQQEVASLKTEIDLQTQHVESLADMLEKMRPLFEDRIIPEIQYQQQISEHIVQQARLETLNRDRLNLESRLLEIRNEFDTVHLRAEADRSALERTLLSTEQQSLVQRGTHLTYIRAPVAGTVSNILVDVGRQIETGSPLATLLPQGVSLDAQVFVPSSAIGFLEPGQQVKLRYDAFPYQKFGVYSGELTELTHVDVPMKELQERFPHLMDKYLGMTFFRATVHPDTQAVEAYGKPIPLRAGLTLEADIQLDRKRLIEWVFDPLLALSGKI